MDEVKKLDVNEVRTQFENLKLEGIDIDDDDLKNALVLAECLQNNEDFVKSLINILLKSGNMKKIVDQNVALQNAVVNYLKTPTTKSVGGKKSRIKRKTRKSYTKKYRGGVVPPAEIPAIIIVLLVVLLVKKLSDTMVGTEPALDDARTD